MGLFEDVCKVNFETSFVRTQSIYKTFFIKNTNRTSKNKASCFHSLWGCDAIARKLKMLQNGIKIGKLSSKNAP